MYKIVLFTGFLCSVSNAFVHTSDIYCIIFVLVSDACVQLHHVRPHSLVASVTSPQSQVMNGPQSY